MVGVRYLYFLRKRLWTLNNNHSSCQFIWKQLKSRETVSLKGKRIKWQTHIWSSKQEISNHLTFHDVAYISDVKTLRVGCVCPWWSRKGQQKQHLKRLICHSIWFLYLAKHTKTSINDLLTQITQTSLRYLVRLCLGGKKKEERKKK